jgi:hypothetical protein
MAAQIGPFTGLFEAVASAVGAGMLLGGFVAGATGLVRRWPKRQFDRRLLRSSYGGVLAALHHCRHYVSLWLIGMDPSDIDLKNPHIALAVASVVVVFGAILVKDSGEGARQLVGLIGLIVLFGTLFGLDARDERRERREGKEPQ